MAGYVRKFNSADRLTGDKAMYPDSNVMERLPPHNRDAERSLLSSMLRDNNVIR